MKATRTHRALFAGIGALFFLFAAWVAHKEIFVAHGRFLQGGQSVAQGKDALLMAALLACFGMSFFGVLFRIFTEVATPLAKAAHEAGLPVKAVIVEIWHRTPPVFFFTEKDADTLKDVADQFVLAGRIAVAVQGTAEGSAGVDEELYEDWLETAYRFSQNIESNWNPANPSRSSSTGDVFRFSYEAGPAPKALHHSPKALHPAPEARSFAVMNVGFKEIAFEPVAHEAQKAARRRPS